MSRESTVGLKALHQALKHWNNEKDNKHRLLWNIPKLLKDIGKEIRHAERYINHLNPETRARVKKEEKKPINKDFVDYSLSPKAYMPIHEPSPVKYPRQSPLKLTLPKPALYPYERTSTISEQSSTSSTRTSSSSEQHWGTILNVPRKQLAIHRGGAVLKFKLGTKDIIQQNVVNPRHTNEFGFMGGIVGNSQDVYDFHDDSDRDEDCLNFTIDEMPRKKKKPGIKMRLPAKLARPQEPEGSNGIESLIQAAGFVGTKAYGRWHLAFHPGSHSRPGRLERPRRRKYNRSPVEENLSNVHQDDDYIYPSLDNSDDEDVHIFKPVVGLK
ncbi:hypothetical protein NQ318_006894 [Aromia moschata]|uniref:Uncharacterized protein n=1 Tax=Aromia moschata TaxID=1265417 RepID=A0AAV8YJ26_9CUCU|nr:hypothetical protein NQ318_006894 [Aromia moschata]